LGTIPSGLKELGYELDSMPLKFLLRYRVFFSLKISRPALEPTLPPPGAYPASPLLGARFSVNRV